MKRTFFIASIILGSGLAVYWNFLGNVFYGTGVASNQQVASVTEALPTTPEKEIIKVPDFVTVTFAGDAMLDRGVEASVKKNFDGDYNKLFDNVDIFKKDDISFLNLEGPVSDIGHNVGSKYSFRMDPKVIGALKSAGVDVVSFANNHVGDYTVKAFTDTLKRLSDGGILFTGAGLDYSQATEPTIIEKNNIKLCFLAFSDVGPNWIKATQEKPGILIASDPNFSSIIGYAKAKCDALIVSFHWGDEYKPHTARQAKLAHLALDSGADIVVGAHPHVPQDIEIYNSKPIMYSLGNFMFDQSWSKPTMQGSVVQMQVYKDGTTKEIKEYTSKQNKFFQIESISVKTKE